MADLDKRRHVLAVVILCMLTIVTLPAQAMPLAARATTFASPRFEQAWRVADLAVQQGQTQRSWTWGPQPWFFYHEFYKQSPNGLRLVQYFDKARMEITYPGTTDGPLDGVSNGLLVVELVSGRVKLGDGIGPDQNAPSLLGGGVPVAGDLRGSLYTITYTSFRTVATVDNGYRDVNKNGQRAGATLATDDNGAARIGFNQRLADLPGVEIVAYEPITGHNVPRVFDDFRNSGPVPAITAFGYPITDPYWIKATVAGRETDVLVQLFERRTLTYTPSNPQAFQVEMGNVGQHYFKWRYPHLGMVWTPGNLLIPIAFGSRRDGPEFNPYKMSPDGSGQTPVNTPAITGNDPPTANTREILPFSTLHSWDPTKRNIWYGDSKYWSGKRQLATIAPRQGHYLGEVVPGRLTTTNSDDYNTTIAPDAAKIAFVSNRDGNPEIYVMNLPPWQNAVQLTATEGCINQYPSWLEDGSGLVYESNCAEGDYEIYRLMLSYEQDRWDAPLVASATRVIRLTDNSSDDHYPRVGPDGATIAFTATRDGNAEIYTMAFDGSAQTRLTTSSGADEAPTWSPEGAKIAFGSTRDGDWEIFVMDRDGSAQTQLTTNDQTDQWPIWW